MDTSFDIFLRMFILVGLVDVSYRFKYHKLNDSNAREVDMPNKTYGSVHLFSHLHAYLLMLNFTS